MGKLLLISMLMLFVSVSLVAGYSLDAENTSYEVCKGSTITVVTEVTGTGDFSVVGSGDATSFAAVVPSSFSLSDETQKVYSYVNPTSSTPKGEYSLEVEVDDGAEKTSRLYSINVKDCRESLLEVVSEKKACACSDVEYSVSLENLGEESQTYTLSVDGVAADWATLDEELSVGAGEKKEFSVTLNPPCNVHGNYDVTVKAVGGSEISAKSELVLEECDDYEISFAEETKKVCENVLTEVPLEINNLGGDNDTFSLKVNGPEWVTVEESVEIDGEEEVLVKLNPPVGAAGLFALEIEAVSESAGVKAKAPLDLIVDKCHGITASLDKKLVTVCDAEDRVYDLVVKNTGESTDRVSLSREGPEWITLSNNELKIDAGEEETVKLNVDIPFSAAKQEYGAKVLLNSENGASTELLFGIILKEEDSCYGGEVSAEETLTVGLEKGRTFTLILKNTGVADATYKISLDGDAEEISLINPEKVSLVPGEEGELYLFVSPPLSTELGKYGLEVEAKILENGEKVSKEVMVNVVEKVEESKGRNFIVRLFSKVWNFLKNPLDQASEEISEEVVEKTAGETTEEVAEEEQANEEIVEESDGVVVVEEGFWSRLLSFFKPVKSGGVVEVEETAENEGGGEETKEGVSDEVVEEKEAGEVVEEKTVEEAAEETTEEVAEEEQADEVEVDGTTVKIDLDSLRTEEESKKMNFNDYKWYVGGALIIIAIIIALSTGVMKKFIDFFEEE